MNPGRELDVLVAEKVMGIEILWKDRGKGILKVPTMDDGWKDVNGRDVVVPVPWYSTSIVAAWEVVEKMIRDGWEVSEAGYSKSTRKWDFTFSNGVSFDGPLCDTAPHAICLAALKAIADSK